MPDWGVIGQHIQVYTLDDMAELAARLGSPVVYDRRGDVLWIDTWRDGMWGLTTGGSGLGNAVELIVGSPGPGPYSVRLTAGSTVGRSATVFRNQAVGFESVMGLEAWIWLAGNNQYVTLQLTRAYPPLYVSGRIRIDPVNDVMAYYNAAGGYTDFAADMGWDPAPPGGRVLKLVVDFQTRTYERVLLDGVTYLLSGIGLRVEAYAGTPVTQVNLTNVSNVAVNGAVLLGTMILTQNEPVSQT